MKGKKHFMRPDLSHVRVGNQLQGLYAVHFVWEEFSRPHILRGFEGRGRRGWRGLMAEFFVRSTPVL